MAACCETLGRAYGLTNAADQMKKWYDQAEQWHAKAQTQRTKEGDDLLVARSLVEFLGRTNQIDKAEKTLSGIVGGGGGVGSAALTAWARRALALSYIARPSRDRALKALALFEKSGQQGHEWEDPADLRVLASVLAAQGTPEERMRAIGILKSLISRKQAISEDRYLMAQIEESNGDWPQAKEHYRELIALTDNPGDNETFIQRLVYLRAFATSLFRHHRDGNEQDLDEIEDQIQKLKELQPNLPEALMLQVELCRLRNELDQAENLIRSYSDRPGLKPQLLFVLASLADSIDRYELAKELYRRAADQADQLGIAHNNLAWLTVLTGGSWKDALELIDYSVQLGGPMLPDFLDTRGTVYLAAGEVQRAITDFEKAVAASPTATKLFHLAQAYLKTNKIQQARENLKAAQAKGLPAGLHRLELSAYQKVVDQLGRP
jgi:tetratricopeptide (TPR) repeat protein